MHCRGGVVSNFWYVRNLLSRALTAPISWLILRTCRLKLFTPYRLERIEEHTGYPDMVKYGLSVDSTPTEKLAKFAHEDSQDGAQQGKERCATSVPPDRGWAEGERDWLDPTDPLAHPLPSPRSDSEESGSGTQGAELLQIMEDYKLIRSSNGKLEEPPWLMETMSKCIDNPLSLQQVP